MTANQAVLILNREAIEQKLNRLAYQIYERNFEENELVICGIAERGYLLAERIFGKLKEITPFSLELVKISLDKQNLIGSQVGLAPGITGLEHKSVIICDDVLYTGKTMAYSAIPFLQGGAKKLECLVLIHRNHLIYPVQPSYIGMSLATTLQEHVSVDLEQDTVYLE